MASSFALFFGVIYLFIFGATNHNCLSITCLFFFITFLHACVFILFFLYPFVSLLRRLLSSLKYTRRQNNAKSLNELYFQVKTKNLFISSIFRAEPCKAYKSKYKFQWRKRTLREFSRLCDFISFSSRDPNKP